ncbi:oxidoreductase [Dyadobacter sp. CY351]|uniref:oxidoreductase n=1 Tax=Dyadobacter sp. CY351 TaxID=2909337 RepID=UPI001F31FE5B|nr:oxidoreductase [Dyadobacter sp. CY351]MCF2518810.1 oxidoreductase [Dyadobacter sp. CY351]
MRNRVVLITGASSGMGKETARLLAANGYTVYAAARRTGQMKDLQEAGVKVLAMDVTNDTSMNSGVDSIIEAEGSIDILINNAGFGLMGSIEDVPLEKARDQMEVNVFGLARLTQLVLPLMRKQQSGKIVNITSTSGKMASPLSGWYSASKFAVEALSDSLRLEVKPFGIDVIIIEPGGVKSEWGDIALKSLHDVSLGTAYGKMAAKIIEFAEKAKPKNAEPIVIAELILKSLTATKPKARYYGGYMAGVILLLKKMLTDRQFDSLLMGQMK